MAKARISYNPIRLTDNEKRVLRLVAKGKGNDDIAAELGSSANTVGKTLRKIYEKLGVRDRQLAVKRAKEAGYI